MTLQQNMSIQHITAEQALPLRMQILRPGQAVQNSIYPEDGLSTTIHWGVFVNDIIVCTGTFFKNVCQHFPQQSEAYRLRGMATDSRFQGQQLGSLLLKFAEKNLKEKKASLLWCNARITAARFYEQNGFSPVGDIFDVPVTGPHQVMYKNL